jgi:hypothetical protein
MHLIFQYGSNCLTARLNARGRLDGLAADKGSAQTVDEYEIAFDVWSCGNECAAADLIRVPGSGHRARGVLYETSDEGLHRLRVIEGPRYEESGIRVRNLRGESKEALTFLVKPRDRQPGLWTSAKYVTSIVKGLRDHKVPEEYTQHVLDVAIRTNEKAENREAAKAQLTSLERLRVL